MAPLPTPTIGTGMITVTYEFLDGGASPCHIYDPSGPYTATVRVTDSASNKSTATANVGTINEPVDVALSVVSVNHCTRGVCFAATASGSTGVYIYDWDWDGDGTYDLLNGGASPCYTYNLGRPYTARVRVTDGNNCQATDEEEVAPMPACWWEHIVFASNRDGNWEIYTMDALSGRSQRNLTGNEADDMLRPVELPLYRIYLPIIVKGCGP